MAVPLVDGFPLLSINTAQAEGVAIEVPESVVVPPPLFKDKILTPGAA